MYPTFAIDLRTSLKCMYRQFHTLPNFLDSQAALSNSNPITCIPSMVAVCTIFMVVFGMIRPGPEPTTYHMPGRHTNHYYMALAVQMFVLSLCFPYTI